MQRPFLASLAAAAALAASAVDAPLHACRALPPQLDAALESLSRECTGPLCGRALRAPGFDPPASVVPSSEPGRAPCRRPDWSGLAAALAETLQAGGFVLLGEVHDNARHHELRAALIAEPSSAAAAVVFEQLTAADRPALDAFNALPAPRTVADLLSALAWDKSPWSKTPGYRTLFEAALVGGRAIHAGDPGREPMRRAAKDGDAAIAPAERDRLALSTPMAPALDAASIAEIEASHCGLIPKSGLPGMAYAQRYRDAHLADALIAANTGAGAILIAGNGHVRTDRGVPWYLARRAQGRPILAVTFSEIEAAAAAAAGHAPRDPEGAPATDWLVLTSPSDRQDPCEEMRAAFGRKQPVPAQGAGEPRSE